MNRFFGLFLASNVLLAEPQPSALSKNQENLRTTLRFGTSEQVRDALVKFGRLNKEEQVPLIPDILPLYDLEDVNINRRLAELAGKTGFPELTRPLPGFLKSGSDDVYYAAVRSLEVTRSAQALPVVQELIDSTDFSAGNKRTADLIRLYGIYGDQSRDAVLTSAVSADTTLPENKSAILRMYAEQSRLPASMLPYLQESLQSEDSPMTLKRAIAYAAGKTKEPALHSHIRDGLRKLDEQKDYDERRKTAPLRIAYIAALTRYGDDDIKSLLIRMSKDDDEAVRLRAIRQLVEVDKDGSREMVEFKSKYDPSLRIQKEAKKILKEKYTLESTTPVVKDQKQLTADDDKTDPDLPGELQD